MIDVDLVSEEHHCVDSLQAQEDETDNLQQNNLVFSPCSEINYMAFQWMFQEAVMLKNFEK